MLVAPVRLVVREDAPDGVVAAAVAAQALERRGDRLLLGARAQVLGELEPEVGRRAADVALGQPQAEHPLRAHRAHADPGDDAGVDAARHRHDGAALAQAPNGGSGLLDQPVQAAGRIERAIGGAQQTL